MCLIVVLEEALLPLPPQMKCHSCVYVHMCVYGKYVKSLANNCCVISSILSVTQRKLNAETQLAHKA